MTLNQMLKEAERNAVRCEDNAATAWEHGNITAHNVFSRQANEYRAQARKIRKRCDRAYAKDEAR